MKISYIVWSITSSTTTAKRNTLQTQHQFPPRFLTANFLMLFTARFLRDLSETLIFIDQNGQRHLERQPQTRRPEKPPHRHQTATGYQKAPARPTEAWPGPGGMRVALTIKLKNSARDLKINLNI